jgi:predicted nucleotidyltransferase
MIHPDLRFAEQAVADFCRRHRIRELSLFGSATRDDFGPESDVDVLVDFAPDAKPTLGEIVTMGEELSALFGRPVDLVDRVSVERSRNYIRRKHILRDVQPVYVAR